MDPTQNNDFEHYNDNNKHDNKHDNEHYDC